MQADVESLPLCLVQNQLALLDIPVFRAPPDNKDFRLVALANQRALRLRLQCLRPGSTPMGSLGIPLKMGNLNHVDFHILVRFVSNQVQDTEFYVFPRPVLQALFDGSQFRDGQVYLPMTISHDPQFRDLRGFEQLRNPHRLHRLGLPAESPDWLLATSNSAAFHL